MSVWVVQPFYRYYSVADPGGGSRWSGPPPPPPIRPDSCLKLKILHRKDRISLFNWLMFLMKRGLHVAIQLNSQDIQKCNYFWVPSYDLFASARKTVFSAPTATGVHRLRNTSSFLLSELVNNFILFYFFLSLLISLIKYTMLVNKE